MKILHVSRTPCAFAPERLSIAISQYTDHTSEWCSLETLKQNKYYTYKLNRVDVVHWHNTYDENVGKHCGAKKNIITYHSPPENTDVINARKSLNKRVVETVVAHYHGCLSAYHKCKLVRNVVDVDYWKEQPYPSTGDTKFHFVMTPTVTLPGTIWQRKGEQQMEHVFKKYLLPKFGPDIIKYSEVTNKSLGDCIRAKHVADVVMDECITPSYHLSGLEGLALGKPTFCWLDDRVKDMLKRISGSDHNPFLGDYVGWLPDILTEFIKQGKSHAANIGKQSEAWMNKYWNTEHIVQEYIDIYNS